MPSIIISSAPGIARAVARPPEGETSGSTLPWITSVGAVMRLELGGAVAGGDDRGELAPCPGAVELAVEGERGDPARALDVLGDATGADLREQAARRAR